jgi:type IV fimbrial biogenesis protein FimT
VLSPGKNVSKSSGFSLVELVIVVAIIGFTAAIAMPSYNAWIQNTKVRTATESILNGIQKARAEALTRNTQVKFTLGANSAWTVQCVTVAACGDLPGGVVETRSNQDGGTTTVTVTATPGGASELIFTNLGIKSTVANQLSQVDLSLTDADRNLRVTIGAGGNVRMCDPSATSTDPRKC